MTGGPEQTAGGASTGGERTLVTSPGLAALPGVVSRLQPPAGAPGELRQPRSAQALLRQVGRAVSDPGAGTPARRVPGDRPPPKFREASFTVKSIQRCQPGANYK